MCVRDLDRHGGGYRRYGNGKGDCKQAFSAIDLFGVTQTARFANDAIDQKAVHASHNMPRNAQLDNETACRDRIRFMECLAIDLSITLCM